MTGESTITSPIATKVVKEFQANEDEKHDLLEKAKKLYAQAMAEWNVWTNRKERFVSENPYAKLSETQFKRNDPQGFQKYSSLTSSIFGAETSVSCARYRVQSALREHQNAYMNNYMAQTLFS